MLDEEEEEDEDDDDEDEDEDDDDDNEDDDEDDDDDDEEDDAGEGTSHRRKSRRRDAVSSAGDGQRHKKAVWSSAEDLTLREAVQRYGERSWTRVAELLPGRIGKQCRDRWCNHLSPKLGNVDWVGSRVRSLAAVVVTYDSKY